MQLKEYTILQITPAAGFSAVYAEDDATVYSHPLACWALIRRVLILDDDDWDRLDDLNLPVRDVLPAQKGEPLQITRVEGLASRSGRELELCENDEYFLGYIGPGENPLTFQDKARDLIDSFEEEDEEEDEEDEDEDEDEDEEDEFEEMTDSLPQALSHLSVQVQERLRTGNAPIKWEQGGWLEFMRRFGDLSGG